MIVKFIHLLRTTCPAILFSVPLLASAAPRWELTILPSAMDADAHSEKRAASASACLYSVLTRKVVSNIGAMTSWDGDLSIYTDSQPQSEFDRIERPCGQVISDNLFPMWIDAKNRRLLLDDASYLRSEIFQRGIKETKALAKFEESRDELMEGSHRRYLAAYREAISQRSLEKIETFEKAYAVNDTDGLIPGLASLKDQIRSDQYRKDFSSASTTEQLERFIAQYEGNDPDALVPRARIKLVGSRQNDQKMVLERQAQENEKQQQQYMQARRADIVRCKAIMDAANATIQREKKVAAISGYENKLALHQAGESIVSCEDEIEHSYTEYRRSGGKEPLSEIK